MEDNINSKDVKTSKQKAAKRKRQASPEISSTNTDIPALDKKNDEILKEFWQKQNKEISQVTDFKNHKLPLARIKKIMKSDEDVGMIAGEAPIIFAKACELFILELTIRSWMHTEESKRRTLQRSDIAVALTKSSIFDFLADIVPKEENQEKNFNANKKQLPFNIPPFLPTPDQTLHTNPSFGVPFYPQVSSNPKSMPPTIHTQPPTSIDPNSQTNISPDALYYFAQWYTMQLMQQQQSTAHQPVENTHSASLTIENNSKDDNNIDSENDIQ